MVNLHKNEPRIKRVITKTIYKNVQHPKLDYKLSFIFMSNLLKNKCNFSQQNVTTLQCKQIFLICFQHCFLSYHDGKQLQFNESLRH